MSQIPKKRGRPPKARKVEATSQQETEKQERNEELLGN
jgi:hypothetical protein